MAKLKKELGLFDVYAIATGATLSSGFFLLPGIAASEAGGMLPLSYLLAGICLVPGLLSMAELSTAMPRAGGIYYFLDRSMGPLVGTVGGFGTWSTLTLKVAFALVGLGAYLRLYLPDAPAMPITLAVAVVFAAVNLVGAKKTSSLQLAMTAVTVCVLAWFIGSGVPAVDPAAFDGAFSIRSSSFISSIGMVVVSYMGLTQVASISEEVRNPERNLPWGMLLAFLTVLAIYVAGTWVMVGVVGLAPLQANGGDLTPASSLAEALAGPAGGTVMAVAAILAFLSVGNAGVLSASRYPLAMSRDQILPARLSRITRMGTPQWAIVATVALIVAWLLLFDAAHIAELAGAFLLLMFALSSLAVIVMRESGLESYDPGFRSPFYPWVQVAGLILPFPLIIEMGWLATFLSVGFVLFGILWFRGFARSRVSREGALYHLFARLGEQRDAGLEHELREILKEKGLRSEDPFEKLVASSTVVDCEGSVTLSTLVDRASSALGERMAISSDRLCDGFLEETGAGVASTSHGVVLPHLRLDSIREAGMVLVRAPDGIEIDTRGAPPRSPADPPVQAAFFLASPEGQHGQHLRILAQIAGRVDDESFLAEWLSAADAQALKEVMLRDEHMLALHVLPEGPTSVFAGKSIIELALPRDLLVAMIRRHGDIVVPKGDTVLQAGDRITFLGDPPAITALRRRYETEPGAVGWRNRVVMRGKGKGRAE